MVGVPGKYKGCETCRRRRVKCSNERPFCQKCISSGRECEGYERERVFITGTPEAKGRVASHPKKVTPSKKQRTPAEETTAPELIPQQPFTSAWDDHTLLTSNGTEYSVLVTALHTRNHHVFRDDNTRDGSVKLRISFSPFAPVELQPTLSAGDLKVGAHCLARLPSIEEGDDVESYFIFLFEHNLSVAPWISHPEQMGMVRRLGATHFASFPNHHYFVRVYRPLAASMALLSRQDTFLSTQEWMVNPWMRHPKSLFDHLLDHILALPGIFARADMLKSMEPTLNLRHRAQDILRDCLALEYRFDAWLRVASQGNDQVPYAYWAEELTSPGGLIPFSNSYVFKDGITGLAFLYYWMAQVLFHRCIDHLHRTIFQPVIDAYPNMWPDLPPDLQVDVTKYQNSRELAADICRGLDSALDSTVQPDMLVAPMTIAMDYYKEINTTSQDGLMEIMWLENFRGRLLEKGQHISDVLQQQEWVEVTRF